MNHICFAFFVEGHLITISAKSFLILTTGYGGEDVLSFLHIIKYIKETGGIGGVAI